MTLEADRAPAEVTLVLAPDLQPARDWWRRQGEERERDGGPDGGRRFCHYLSGLRDIQRWRRHGAGPRMKVVAIAGWERNPNYNAAFLEELKSRGLEPDEILAGG